METPYFWWISARSFRIRAPVFGPISLMNSKNWVRFSLCPFFRDLHLVKPCLLKFHFCFYSAIPRPEHWQEYIGILDDLFPFLWIFLNVFRGARKMKLMRLHLIFGIFHIDILKLDTQLLNGRLSGLRIIFILFLFYIFLLIDQHD